MNIVLGIKEETKKYKAEYEKALKEGVEYNRGTVFRAEKEAKEQNWQRSVF